MRTVGIEYRSEEKDLGVRPRPTDANTAFTRLIDGNRAFVELLDSAKDEGTTSLVSSLLKLASLRPGTERSELHEVARLHRYDLESKNTIIEPTLKLLVLFEDRLACSIRLSLVLAVALVCLPMQSYAQSPLEAGLPEVEFGARKMFLMLFLMLGPIKILVPFVRITNSCDTHLRRRMARRAILFSAAALAIAGVLGRTMLENFEISLPVLAMTGGIILFLVALQTVLQPSASLPDISTQPNQPPPDLKFALTPLAFPTIVTPYGIAAVIVFATLAGGRQTEGLTVTAIVLLILALDWAAMIFAQTILRWIGTPLQVLAVVLGVTQAALGLQIILHSLNMIAL
ncbi:MarC family protein [Ensifer adhaerens]|uniref:MarC family protein n=1 Tax=Ensifer adhaerens TaxID=106592 RepID=UPI0023AA11C5|nr:MarC family protein [Ensifer adhaerens]WDZ76746.1 MarC family protein [Ensifer adhaerens]